MKEELYKTKEKLKTSEETSLTNFRSSERAKVEVLSLSEEKEQLELELRRVKRDCLIQVKILQEKFNESNKLLAQAKEDAENLKFLLEEAMKKKEEAEKEAQTEIGMNDLDCDNKKSIPSVEMVSKEC